MKVIKIGAVWCNGCLVMRPRWLKIEEENPWLETEYHDVDTDTKIVKKYVIDNGKLPVCIFIDKNGKELTRISGEIEKEELLKVIGKYRHA